MKKILLSIFCFFAILAPSIVRSQTFTVTADTVNCNITGVQSCYDNIYPISAPVNMKWRVIGSNFPADWLVDTVLGICDANLCRANSSGGQLWNGTSGTPFYCTYNSGPSAVHSFYVLLNLSNVTSTGCYWMRVRLEDSAGAYVKNVTFVVCKAAAAVPTVTLNSNDVLLYPNPANSELNVVYDANADIKNIAVYNIIGKLMTIYKVSGSSANLNLESVPSGIYFVRLLNSQGNAVLTRKFTKQ